KVAETNTWFPGRCHQRPRCVLNALHNYLLENRVKLDYFCEENGERTALHVAILQYKAIARRSNSIYVDFHASHPRGPRVRRQGQRNSGESVRHRRLNQRRDAVVRL